MAPFWRGCCGYLEVAVSGPGALAAIQAAADQGLCAWGVRRVAGGFRAFLPASQFSGWRPIARRCRAQVRILARRGLPFMIRPPVRKVAWSGLAVLILALYALGSFIWRVEITGLAGTAAPAVQRVLREAGLYPGALRHRVDVPGVEAHLLDALPSLSWAGIELRGAVARVRVIEKEGAGEALDAMAPADLVAAKAGRIQMLIVLAGQPRVAEGDQVQPGQVLISGDPPPLEFGGRAEPPPGWPPAAVRARGHVRAHVSYEVRAVVPWVRTYDRRTGRTWHRSVLRLGTRELALTGGAGPPFDRWEAESATLAWPGPGGGQLAELASVTYYEVERITLDLGPGGARLEAEAMARSEFGHRLVPGALVISQVFLAEEAPGASAVRLVVEVIEDIARVRRRGAP